jgi:hypothetical protein
VQQYVGIDLHRRRTVTVRTDVGGETPEAGRITNDPDTLATVMAWPLGASGSSAGVQGPEGNAAVGVTLREGRTSLFEFGGKCRS